MNVKKVRLMSALAVGAALFVGACGTGNGAASGGETETDAGAQSAAVEEPEENGDQRYVAVVSQGYQHQFWQAVKRGSEEAAEEYNVRITYEGPDAETNIDQQIQMLQGAFDRHPDAIALAALDSTAPIPLLENAESEGIPVVAFDSGVDSDIPVTTVTTDNKGAAAEAAKQMAEAIDHEGEVALVVQDQTSKSAVDRRDGFVEYMEENEPNIEIVDIQYGGGDHAKSADLAKAMISGHADLAGLYGTNEGSAIGIVQAVKEMGIPNGEIAIIGFDSGQAQVEAVREGVMLGAISQDPIGLGYETIKAAVEALDGETLPETIYTGFYWYTADNMDDDEIQAVLYD